MKKFPDYVHGYNDRLGKPRHYYKRTGSKPRCLARPAVVAGIHGGLRAAHAAYEQPDAVPLGASRTLAGTLDAALVQYYESAKFLQGLARARRDRSAACWNAGARITASCR